MLLNDEPKYTPKVSIVIPAYNASNYLSKAIDCALAQTYENVEIIVVNDGSEDDGATRKIAESYADKVRYFEKENGGSSSALNAGIRAMTGEWFSWLSHDDIYHPQKIEKQIDYINRLAIGSEPISNNVLFSAVDLIDKNGKIIRKQTAKKARKIAEYVASIDNNGMLVCKPTEFMFYGCTCLIHKSVFDKIGAFDETLRLLNDLDMWYRIYVAGYKIHYLPETLVQARVHSKQISRSIGFSYHNAEQDMYWSRCLNWLKENYPKDYKLFIKYGCNAYQKTRNAEGNEAFAYAGSINRKCIISNFARKVYYISYATIRNMAKSIYIKLRLDLVK